MTARPAALAELNSSLWQSGFTSSAGSVVPVSPLPCADDGAPRSLLARSLVLTRRGDYATAMRDLQRASDAAAEEDSGSDWKLRRDIHEALGEAMVRGGHPLDAVGAFRDAAVEATAGGDACGAWGLRVKAASARGGDGDHTASIAELERLLEEIKEEAPGSDVYLRCRQVLGSEFMKTGRRGEALQELRFALRGYRVKYGDLHMCVAECNAAVAEVLLSQKRLSAAYEHVELARAAVKGSIHKPRKDAWEEQELFCAVTVLRARCLEEWQDDDAAAAEYRRAAAIRGAHHPQSKKCIGSAETLTSPQRVRRSPRRALLDGKAVGFPSSALLELDRHRQELAEERRAAAAARSRSRSPMSNRSLSPSPLEQSLGHSRSASPAPSPTAAPRWESTLGGKDPVLEYLEDLERLERERGRLLPELEHVPQTSREATAAAGDAEQEHAAKPRRPHTAPPSGRGTHDGYCRGQWQRKNTDVLRFSKACPAYVVL